MKNIAIFMVIFGVSNIAVADKIYKWVDENGQIHYSSQKPPGQAVETVKVKKGPKVTQTTQTESDETSNDEAQTQEDAQAEALAKEQLAKSDAANSKRLCELAKKNIASLNASVRVNKLDEKTGQTVRMTDDERLNALKKAQKAVRDYCK